MISRRVWRLTVFMLVVGLASLEAAQQNSAVEMEVSQHLAAAQKAEQARDYPAASRQYQEILKLQPKLAIIRQNLAITYHLQNRYPEAIAEFQRALRIDSSLWGSDLFLGMDYYKTQFALALEPLKASIALNAKMAEPEARFWLAVTDSALNRPEHAVRELRRDLALRPANINVLYYLAKAYDQAAASAFERLGTVEPHAAAVSLLEAEHFWKRIARTWRVYSTEMRCGCGPILLAGFQPLPMGRLTRGALSDLTIAASDARANVDLAALLTGAGEIDRATALLQNLVRQKAADPRTSAIMVEASARLTALPQAQAPNGRETLAEIAHGIVAIQLGHFHEAEETLSRSAEKRFESYVAASGDPRLRGGGRWSTSGRSPEASARGGAGKCGRAALPGAQL